MFVQGVSLFFHQKEKLQNCGWYKYPLNSEELYVTFSLCFLYAVLVAINTKFITEGVEDDITHSDICS